MTPTIADAWLPHDTICGDERLPIQAIRINIPVKRVPRRISKQEDGLQNYKGAPWTVYFRRRKNGFMIPLQ